MKLKQALALVRKLGCKHESHSRLLGEYRQHVCTLPNGEVVLFVSWARNDGLVGGIFHNEVEYITLRHAFAAALYREVNDGRVKLKVCYDSRTLKPMPVHVFIDGAEFVSSNPEFNRIAIDAADSGEVYALLDWVEERAIDRSSMLILV